MQDLESLITDITSSLIVMLNSNNQLMSYKTLDENIKIQPQVSVVSTIHYILYDDIKNVKLYIHSPNLYSKKDYNSYMDYDITIDYFDKKGNPISVELDEHQKDIIIPILMSDKFHHLSLYVHKLIKPIIDDTQITSNRENVNLILKNISNRINIKNKKEYLAIFKGVKDLSSLNKKIQYSEELNKDIFNLTKEDKETISLMYDFSFNESLNNKKNNFIHKIISKIKR